MLNLTDNSLLNEESKLISLKTLFLSNKKLKYIPSISNYDKIEILYLNDNEIPTLSFCQNMTNLKELYMKNNNITDLSEIDYLSLCKNLHTIYLKGNPIQFNYNQIYMKKIKKTVCSIKNIDGFIVIPNQKLNLHIFLKNSPNNKKIKNFNRNLLSDNIKINYLNKNNNSAERKSEKESNKKLKVYKDYKSVDNNKIKNHNIKLKKYNNEKKLWNYVNFNHSINNKSERRTKSDFGIIKRLIDESRDNICVNHLNIASREENKSSSEKKNIFNSVKLLLNGLNLIQLRHLQIYVNKKLSTKLNEYNE